MDFSNEDIVDKALFCKICSQIFKNAYSLCCGFNN